MSQTGSQESGKVHGAANTKLKELSSLLFPIEIEAIILLQADHKRLSQVQKKGSASRN